MQVSSYSLNMFLHLCMYVSVPVTTYIHEYIECILPEVSGESFPTIGFELCESAAEVHEPSHVGELRMGLHNVQLPAAADGVA